MSNDNNFSLKAIIVTALITFTISGFGGFFLKEWQDRAKAEIIIGSIGFSPSRELINIDSTLRSISESNTWGRSYKQYEEYSTLDDDHKSLIKIEKLLKKGIENVNEWLDKNKYWASETITVTELADINQIPYCQESIIGAALIGSINRNEIEDPPNSIEYLETMSEVAELYRDHSGWRIHLGPYSVGFPDEDSEGRRSEKAIELLAKSFAYGCKQNIFFYMKKFVELSFEDLLAVQELKLKLEEILLPASHLSVSVSIYNSGKSPVTLKPYMALFFQNDELNKKTLLLQIVDNKELNDDSNVFGMKKIFEDTEGVDVKVDPFLPNSVGSKYLFVAPNSGKTIKLSSVEPLGHEKGKRIIALFEANALRSRVVALSNEGKTIFSTSVLFGKSISKADKELIATVALN